MKIFRFLLWCRKFSSAVHAQTERQILTNFDKSFNKLQQTLTNRLSDDLRFENGKLLYCLELENNY